MASTRSAILVLSTVALAAACAILAGAAPPGGGNTPPPNPAIAYLDAGIKVMNADGTNSRLVVRNVGSGSNLSSPTWSPDGQQLVFTGLFNGVQGIWTVNLDGTNRRLVLATTGTNPEWSPTAAPDGQTKIAFMDNNDVFLVNLDGTGLQNLTTSIPQASTAAWARDGSHLVISLYQSIVLADLSLSGGAVAVVGVTPLVSVASGSVNVPHWANAHDALAYLELNLTTGARITLLDLSVTPWIPYPLTSGNWPSFSPDDSKLVFGAGGGIYVINADGSGSQRILRSGTQPCWKR